MASDPGTESETSGSAPRWHENRQAFVQTAADGTFGLFRDDTAAGRRPRLEPPTSTHGVDGRPATGLLFLLADSTIGSECVRSLEPDEVIVTSSLHLELHADPFHAALPVRGMPQPARRFHGTASAIGDLVAGDEVVATASGRFAVLHGESRTGGVVGPPTGAEQPPPPAVVSSGEAPIDDLLEAVVAPIDEQSLKMTITASPRFANERFGVHGGVGALIGERACDALVRSVADPAFVYRTAEMRAAFLRPIAADSARLDVVARLKHRGRRLVAVTATLFTPAGVQAVVVDLLAAGVPQS